MCIFFLQSASALHTAIPISRSAKTTLNELVGWAVGIAEVSTFDGRNTIKKGIGVVKREEC